MKKFEEYAFRFLFGLALLEIVATLYWLLVIGRWGLAIEVDLAEGQEPPSIYRKPYGYTLAWTASGNAFLSTIALLVFRRARWLLAIVISVAVFFIVFMAP